MRIGKLTALQVQRALRAREPGLINDGGGLYLKDGGSWIFRFKRGGKTRDHGLGPVLDVSLAEARQKAAEARRLLLDGKDPVETRRASRAAALTTMSFAEAAEAYIAAHRAGWRSEKHLRQWRSSLATYACPVIGQMPADAIGTADIMRVLGDLWATKSETASRLRGRIEAVLDWARVRGLRSGENPARWKGHLDHLLPARAKVRAVAHFAPCHTARSATSSRICDNAKACRHELWSF
jgi:hypothetical protein